MVKFEFTLSDVDAENILSIIREPILKYHSLIMDSIIEGNDEMKKYYNSEIDYIENLAKLIARSSSRVEEDTQGS